ncbi:unnamed protein product [Discosporangium mesarthrocarpum]
MESTSSGGQGRDAGGTERGVVTAAGGRRPMGYGAGPFADLSATLNSEVEATADVYRGEERAVAEMEDEGRSWPATQDLEVNVIAEESHAELHGLQVGALEFVRTLAAGLVHLSRASSRARYGLSWAKVQRACELMWNTVVSLWLSPQDFARKEDRMSSPFSSSADSFACGATKGLLLEPHARIYAKASEALMDALEALVRQNGTGKDGVSRMSDGGCGSTSSSQGLISAKQDEDHLQDADNQPSGDGNKRGFPNGSKPDQGRGSVLAPVSAQGIDEEWVSRMVEWGLQALHYCRCWGMLVKVGCRFIEVTEGRHGGHRVFPLILHAQRRLCSRASAVLQDRVARLNTMDKQFEEAQAHRQKRKVRKAIETRSREEIEHERARQPLVDAVGDARGRKQIHDHRLGTLAQSRDGYLKTKK